jgi:hypothetical protein
MVMRSACFLLLSVFVVIALTACISERLAIKERVPVLSDDECYLGERDSAMVIGYLNAGDTVEALATRYPKQCRVIKVRMPDGRTGWVTTGSETDLLPPDPEPPPTPLSNSTVEHVWPMIEGYILLLIAGWIGVDAIRFSRGRSVDPKMPWRRRLQLSVGLGLLVLGMYLVFSSLTYFLKG